MANKNRRKRARSVNSTPLFKAGDIVKLVPHGKGIIQKIDESQPREYEWFYFINFAVKGGNGTKGWFGKTRVEKRGLLLTRDGVEWDNTQHCKWVSESCPMTCFGEKDCPRLRRTRE